MKNKSIYTLLSIFAFLILNTALAAQSIDKITRRCPSPNNGVYASVLVQGDGAVRHTPCPSKASIFTGLVDFTGATVSGIGGVSGSGTTNFIPRWTSTSALGNTPISWNNTVYEFNSAAGTANFKAFFTPSVGSTGRFLIGSQTTACCTPSSTGAYIDLNEAPQGVAMSGGQGASLSLTGFAGIVGQTILTSVQWFRITAPSIQLQRTVTASGTTGNRTIDLANGSVNFAAGATALTVTNSTVTANSLVIAVANTNDSTCSVKNAVAGAGSFVINMTAACTAETRVGFWVTN